MMNTIAFDTLKFAQMLEQAGMDTKQAEALAAAQREAFSQLAQEQLSTQEKLAQMQAEVKFAKESFATKSDIARVETRMEAEFRFLKWTQGIVLTGIVAILVSIFVKLFF